MADLQHRFLPDLQHRFLLDLYIILPFSQGVGKVPVWLKLYVLYLKLYRDFLQESCGRITLGHWHFAISSGKTDLKHAGNGCWRGLVLTEKEAGLRRLEQCSLQTLCRWFAGGVRLFFHTLLPENHQSQFLFLRIAIKMCDSPSFLSSKAQFYINNCTLVWKLLDAHVVESCFLLWTLYRFPGLFNWHLFHIYI